MLAIAPPLRVDGVRRSEVTLVLLDNKQANKLVVEEHYLHRPRVGKLVSYGVLHKGQMSGVLMYAKPMVCHPMFGFKPVEIVELARVWFKDNPYNLGSCAIRLSLKRLVKDWPGVRVVISWCDTSRFDGALYRATGFEFKGLSRVRSIEPSAKLYGGGRPDRKVQDDRLTRKQRWIIVLDAKDPKKD